MPSTAPINRVPVPTSAARMRRIGHMYLISVVAPISTVTTPSVTHAVTLCSTTAHTTIAAYTSSDAGQQRHDDADQTDGDGECNEDDPAGAHASNLRRHGRLPRTHWMLPSSSSARRRVRDPRGCRRVRLRSKKWTPPLGSRRNSDAGASQRSAPSRPSGRRAAAPCAISARVAAGFGISCSTARETAASTVSSRSGSCCASARRKPTLRPRLRR